MHVLTRKIRKLYVRQRPCACKAFFFYFLGKTHSIWINLKEKLVGSFVFHVYSGSVGQWKQWHTYNINLDNGLKFEAGLNKKSIDKCFIALWSFPVRFAPKS